MFSAQRPLDSPDPQRREEGVRSDLHFTGPATSQAQNSLSRVAIYMEPGCPGFLIGPGQLFAKEAAQISHSRFMLRLADACSDSNSRPLCLPPDISCVEMIPHPPPPSALFHLLLPGPSSHNACRFDRNVASSMTLEASLCSAAMFCAQWQPLSLSLPDPDSSPSLHAMLHPGQCGLFCRIPRRKGCESKSCAGANQRCQELDSLYSPYMVLSVSQR